MRKAAPEVNEAIRALNVKSGLTQRKLLTGTGLVSAMAVASASLTACPSGSSAAKRGNSCVAARPSAPFWPQV
jgi:simple sugar transport system substrate-binding protein